MSEPTDWTQLALLPADQVELVIRVGVVQDSLHMQWQVEARDPASGALLAMHSAHHRCWMTVDRLLQDLHPALDAIWRDHVLPF